MNIEELEAIADAMAEEGGDMIDALYDTITLTKDTYCGFICRLREVVRLAKNEQKKSAPVGNAAKLREALISCRKKLANIKPGDFVAGVLIEVIATADAALAASADESEVAK